MNADIQQETEKVPSGDVLLPRVQMPADEGDVMTEQLEFLIDHVAEQGICGCPECQRYLRARAVLLEIFTDPAPQVVLKRAAELPLAA